MAVTDIYTDADKPLGYETGNTLRDTGYISPPTGTYIDTPSRPTIVVDYHDYLFVEIRCPCCGAVLKPHKCGEKEDG